MVLEHGLRLVPCVFVSVCLSVGGSGFGACSVVSVFVCGVLCACVCLSIYLCVCVCVCI